MTTVVMTSDSAGAVVVAADDGEVETAGEETAGVDSIPTALEVETTAEVSETGQIVVETATETVVKTVERAGQSVTVSAQEMIVDT
jgi:hypothetical protein